MNNGHYTLFVAEGESQQKRKQILHNAYLARASRSLAHLRGSMFVYGHSLADNDAHIFHLIVKSKIKQLFISIFGDPNNQENRQTIARSKALATQRTPGKPLQIQLFDAASAKVWG